METWLISGFAWMCVACNGGGMPSSDSASHPGPVATRAGSGGTVAAMSESGGAAAKPAQSGAAAVSGGGGQYHAGSGGDVARGMPVAAAGRASAGVAGMAAIGGAGGAAAVGGAGNAGSGAGNAGSGAETTAKPSAGCAKMAGRPSGGKVTQGDRIYAFPDGYDGTTPMPFLLALHAAGNPNTQLQSLTDGTRLATSYVRAFPKSAGNAWVYDTDIAKLKSVVDDVRASYCIDENRIFATGHSSGAQMVVQLLCHTDLMFKAVAPVAASKYCAKVSPIPVLYIQGMMDAQRGGGNGSDVVSVFTSSNSCSSANKPKNDVPMCNSTFDRMPVTPGCVIYDGCMEPTLWCSHNDNGYNSTDGHEHGWPCFASNAIADFFMSLP